MKTRIPSLFRSACLAFLLAGQHLHGAIFYVTNANDAGPNSLRQAIANANAVSGEDNISLGAALSGRTISLTSGQIVITDSVTVDGRSVLGGVTISGSGANRIFTVNGGSSLTLKGLTLTGGNGVGTDTGTDGLGGAILCKSNATVGMDSCTLSGNASAKFGGAIHNVGTLTLTNCTITGNSAGQSGGALYANAGTSTLSHCTISGNSAHDYGGGIFKFPFGSVLQIRNTIVAGNNAPSGRDIYSTSPVTRAGHNLIGSNDTVDSVFPPGSPNANGDLVGTTAAPLDARLLPLDNYGGPTQTLFPRADSPAISNGTNSVIPGGISTDQRGSPRIFDSTVDIGAVERGLVVNTGADELNEPRGTNVSLREAIRDASPGMVINFESRLSSVTITLDPAKAGPADSGNPDSDTGILIDKNLEINAGGLDAGITVNGASQNFRLFHIASAKVVAMHNVTMANGGGADFNDFGGGISVDDNARLTLTRCTLRGNSVKPGNSGGGINLRTGSTLFLKNCTLSGNTGDFGGGLHAVGSPLLNPRVIADSCTLEGNTARNGSGGAFGGSLSSASFIQCTLTGNTARGSDSGNGLGGGIFTANSSLTLTHCTITRNTAHGDADNGAGGGVFVDGQGSGRFAIANTIIAGNTALSTGPDLYENAIAAFSFTGRVWIGDFSGNRFTVRTDGSVLTGDPQLSPLGNFGGPTRTMPPLSGSPVVDQANGVPRAGTGMDIEFPTDQRGLPRRLDGNGDDTSLSDLGATEQISSNLLHVTNTADSGPGSLRQAIAYAAFCPAAPAISISFADDLSGPIELVGEIQIPTNVPINLNALNVHGGLVLSGRNSNRIFIIPLDGGDLSLTGMTLTRGRGGIGGAILNGGTLRMSMCTLSGNSGDRGGAICHAGRTALLYQCTLAGNAADDIGGAIYTARRLALSHCTLADNRARMGSEIYNENWLTLTNTIVAANTAAVPTGSNIFTNVSGTVSTIGRNLIGTLRDSGIPPGSGILTGDPRLEPLANYGGPTQSMRPRPDSPAINRATPIPPPVASDQRGFPISGLPDIGAVERVTPNITITGNRDFGAFLQSDSAPPLPLQITFPGPGILTGLRVSSTNADFPVHSAPDTSLQPDVPTPFSVDFTPRILGLQSTTLEVFSDRCDDPFAITLTANVALPQIAVRGPGGEDIGTGDSIDYGPILVGTPVTRTFTIHNPGLVDLKDLAVSVEGAEAGRFTITPPPTDPLHAGQDATFTVTFEPTARGSFSATLSIGSNRPEGVIDIPLIGTGVAPEIGVKLAGGGNLRDGKSTVRFGAVPLGNSSKKKITIRNTGDGPLNGLKITSNGKNKRDFRVTRPRRASLDPGDRTTFRLQFTPGVAGNRKAGIHIRSNDSDENPFDIMVTGTGTASPP